MPHQVRKQVEPDTCYDACERMLSLPLHPSPELMEIQFLVPHNDNEQRNADAGDALRFGCGM